MSNMALAMPIPSRRWVPLARSGACIMGGVVMISDVLWGNPGITPLWGAGAGLYALALLSVPFERWLKRRDENSARASAASFLARPDGGRVLSAAAFLAISIREEMYMGEEQIDHMSVDACVINGELKEAKVVMPTIVPGSVEGVSIIDGMITVRLIDGGDPSLRWRIMEIARERIPGLEVGFTVEEGEQ